MDASRAKAAIAAIRQQMDAGKDRLIELDSQIGDGDLGLTMKKGFAAADEAVRDSDETDVGKVFMAAGMAMAKAAPSTMGTLVGTGFMRGGKAVSGKENLDKNDVAGFFRAFSDGLMQRGKAAPGDKTIIDVIDPVATALEKSNNAEDMAARATDAARAGLAASNKMMAQHGKAAVFREKTVGMQDGGATAGLMIVEGFFSPVQGRTR